MPRDNSYEIRESGVLSICLKNASPRRAPEGEGVRSPTLRVLVVFLTAFFITLGLGKIADIGLAKQDLAMQEQYETR